MERDPPRSTVGEAFTELGTCKAVASAFGVSRDVVKRWVREYELTVTSRPEAGLASEMKWKLARYDDRCRVAQWLMDEGSVSVAHFKHGDYTILIVCGSMNDRAVLLSISEILDAGITSSNLPGPTTLPMSAIRVHSARAYALLEIIGPHLVGLKAMEARAALKFFPPSGLLRGRHTIDEFLTHVWEESAIHTLHEWNSRRINKLSGHALENYARGWVEGRIRRARGSSMPLPSRNGARRRPRTLLGGNQ